VDGREEEVVIERQAIIDHTAEWGSKGLCIDAHSDVIQTGTMVNGSFLHTTMRPIFFLLVIIFAGCASDKNTKTTAPNALGEMTVIYQGPISLGSNPPIESLWEVADVGKGVTAGAVQFTLRLTLSNDQIKTVVVSSMEVICEPFPKARSLPGLISVDTVFADGRHTHESDPAKSDIWQGFQHNEALKDLCRQAGVAYR